MPCIIRNVVFGLATVALAVGSTCAPVFAQAPAGAAPPVDAGQGLGGPVVPGVCMISREGVIANSKVGVAAAARIKQLAQEAQAEVDALRKPLEAEAAAAWAQAAKLNPDQRRAQEKVLSDKLAPIKAKADLRSREIDRTRANTIEAIAAHAQPAIASVYRQHNCGLLLDRSSVLGGNYANDLTADVVKALDARLTALDIRRVDLSAEAPAPR